VNRILRYEVPIDLRWHTITGCSEPLHIGARSSGVIEFWAWEREGVGSAPYEYRVYGTGHTIDEPVRHVGSVIAEGGYRVWHLVSKI
jgi:hypothetical protein